MKRVWKLAAVASVAGALAWGVSVPSYAAHGRNTAAAIGFGAGALVGAAAANANNAYYGGPDYAYAPESEAYAPGSYAYDENYAEPGYDAYAYQPAYRGGGWSGCSTMGSHPGGKDLNACGY